jgi:hypothetical protein
VARSIDELKERIHRKHADDYRRARKWAKAKSLDELETNLAELEKRLPRFGETRGGWTGWSEDDQEGLGPDCPFTIWITDDLKGDLMTAVRAFRDEISERYSREAIHDQVDYDS